MMLRLLFSFFMSAEVMMMEAMTATSNAAIGCVCEANNATVKKSKRRKNECSKRVTSVLQACYKRVTSVLQVCYKCVTSVLQVCYKCVTSVLQVCHKSVTKESQVCYKCVTSMLQLYRRRRSGKHRKHHSFSLPHNYPQKDSGGRIPT
jgi:hypothetical protein